MFKIDWTPESISQKDRFLEFNSSWETMMEQNAHVLAEYAKEYFKPMLNVRNNPRGNGDTAESIRYDINMNGGDFEVTYNGLLSALYMDVGNFPSGSVLSADEFGLKMFPVDKRFGVAFPTKTIHGMGHFTPGVPTHWSDETVRHMADDGVALEYAMEHLREFMSKVVIEI
jgi:hypothetical protein